MDSKTTAKHRLSWLFRKSPKIAAPHSNIVHLSKGSNATQEHSTSDPPEASGAGLVEHQSTVVRIGGENKGAVQMNDQPQGVQRSKEQTTIDSRKSVVVPPSALRSVDHDKIGVRPATVPQDGKETREQLGTEQRPKESTTSANQRVQEGRIKRDFKDSDQPKSGQKTSDRRESLQKSKETRYMSSEQQKSGFKLSDQQENRRMSDHQDAVPKSMQTAHRSSHLRESPQKPVPDRKLSEQREKGRKLSENRESGRTTSDQREPTNRVTPKTSVQRASESEKRLTPPSRKSVAPIDPKKKQHAKGSKEKLEKNPNETLRFSETQELLSMHAPKGSTSDKGKVEDEQEDEEDEVLGGEKELREVLHRRVDYRLRVELTALEESFVHSLEWWEILEREKSSAQGVLLQIKRERATRLVTACRDGDSATVLSLLDVGGDPSAQDSTGMTGLHYASWSGDCEISKLLLKRGADVNAMGFEERAPLHFASIFDKVDCVKLLLDHGANIHQLDRYWWTPLHYASASDSQAAGKILLAAGAEVRLKDIQGFTPLEVSAPGEMRRLLMTAKQEKEGATTKRPKS